MAARSDRRRERDEADPAPATTVDDQPPAKKARHEEDRVATTEIVAAPTIATSSPASRCDQDSLSVVLSFLGSAAFASSVQVSRRWRAAASTRTAGSAGFDLATVVRRLRTRDHDFFDTGSSYRHVCFNLSDPATAELLVQSPIYRHATSAAVEDLHWDSEAGQAAHLLLQLPHLVAVEWSFGSDDATDAFNQFTTAVQGRLQMLTLRSWSNPNDFSSLGQLRQLRVLVVNFWPPASELRQLVQLQYLRLEELRTRSAKVPPIIRDLSIRHQLTSVRFACHSSIRDFSQELIADLTNDEPAPAQQAVPGALESEPLPPAAQLTDLSLSGSVPWRHFERLSQMSQLERVDCELLSEGLPTLPVGNLPMLKHLARLREIKLAVHALGSARQPYFLALFTGLRTLHLDLDKHNGGNRAAGANLALFLPVMNQLEDFTLIATALESSWSALAKLPRLTRLVWHPRYATPSAAFIALHLAALPQFTLLELHFDNWRAEPWIMPAAILARAMQLSSTWRELRIKTRVLSLADGDDQLQSLEPDAFEALTRLRVNFEQMYVKSPTRSASRAGVRDDGRRAWLEVARFEG